MMVHFKAIIRCAFVAAATILEVDATVSDTATCASDGLSKSRIDDEHERRILSDIATVLSDEYSINADDLNVPRSQIHVDAAIRDCSQGDEKQGVAAWRFLYGLASSDTFVQHVWHKRPLLIRAANTGGWVERFFTVDRDLR